MANCESCKKVQNAPEMEWQIKRLWIALIVAVCLLFASNAGWLYAWCQYDYSGEEIVVEQDAQDGGNANYIGNDGDIYNGYGDVDETN